MSINKWNQRYFNLAEEVSTWSKDPSSKIGAVIVGTKGQIISQGFNGFPRGINDSNERYNNRAEKYKFVVHAEKNSIFNAIHNGASTNGATIYIFGLPVCHECAKGIIQCGISKVFCKMSKEKRMNSKWNESEEITKIMFKEANIEYKVFYI